jgi:hypothetical protein
MISPALMKCEEIMELQNNEYSEGVAQHWRYCITPLEYSRNKRSSAPVFHQRTMKHWAVECNTFGVKSFGIYIPPYLCAESSLVEEGRG